MVEIVSVCWQSCSPQSTILQHCPVLAACHHRWVTDVQPHKVLCDLPLVSHSSWLTHTRTVLIYWGAEPTVIFQGTQNTLRLSFISAESKGCISNSPLRTNVIHSWSSLGPSLKLQICPPLSLSYMHVYTQTYIHTYKHTYKNNTHIYIHMYLLPVCLSPLLKYEFCAWGIFPVFSRLYHQNL